MLRRWLRRWFSRAGAAAPSGVPSAPELAAPALAAPDPTASGPTAAGRPAAGLGPPAPAAAALGLRAVSPAPAPAPAPAPVPSPPPALQPELQPEMQVRAEPEPEPEPERSRALDPARARAPALRLALDDGGEYLVTVGSEFTLGGADADVDLPLGGGLAGPAARLALGEDFHAGPAWRIAPLGAASLSVDAHSCGARGVALADGARIALGTPGGPALGLRFVAREAGSASALLELEGGAECLGASRVLLLAIGPGGRALIGSRRARLVRVPGLEREVRLVALRGERGLELALRSSAGLAASPGAEPLEEQRFELPLAQRALLFLPPRALGERPFALILAPVGAGLGPRALER